MRTVLLLLMNLICLLAFAQDTAKLERSVDGRVLKSQANPVVELKFAQGFQYAGGQVIDIFHVAGAEQHFFVDADQNKAVKRFYWIQFEHYYPTNQHVYDYSGISQQPLKVGRLEFAADAKIAPDYFTDDRPGSDSGAAIKLLQQKGYKLDGTFARVRMFHLPDATNRKELMIIYGEAFPPGASEETAKQAAWKHARENIEIK